MRACKAFAVILAMGVLVAGCNDSPTDDCLSGSELEPAAVVSTTRPVVVIMGGAEVGEATITRNANGATARLHTTGLTPGNVYTMWWVVFDNPEECSDIPTLGCDASDLANPLVNGGAKGVAAHMVGSSGRASFGARLNLGDVLDGGGAPTFNTFDDLLGSEMHLVVRNHGPALPGQLAEQFSEFNGGCPPNSCANVQASVHPAP